MEDAVQMMMCGADSIGVCTETMIHGFAFLQRWMKSLKDYMKKMGFQTARDFRDLLVEQIKSAAELTVWAGVAQVDPEECSSCGLCAQIGHCNAIIPDRCGGLRPSQALPGLLHLHRHRHLPERRHPHDGNGRHGVRRGERGHL